MRGQGWRPRPVARAAAAPSTPVSTEYSNILSLPIVVSVTKDFYDYSNYYLYNIGNQ